MGETNPSQQIDSELFFCLICFIVINPRVDLGFFFLFTKFFNLPPPPQDIVNALASQLVLEPNTTDINGLLADLGRDNPFLSASQLDQLAALAHQQARAIIGQNTQQSQQFLAMQPPQSHFLPNISPLVSSPADSNLSSFHLQCHQQCVPEGGLSRSVSNLQYPQVGAWVFYFVVFCFI